MMREAMRDDRMGRRLRFGATLLLVSALLAPTGRADDAAAPPDAAAMAALGIARPVTPNAGPWSWTTGNYAYDASGNITAIGTQSFAYDTRGRLVDATLVRPDQPGSEHETFAYDAFGNMTSRTGASAYSVATPASLATNHLVGATYDGAGNVTLLTPAGQAFQYEYTYDALGSLNQARAANVAGETRQFSIYTADDERIWTYDLGVNTSHWKIRDLGGRVLRDYVVTGDTWQLSRDYVYRGEQMLAAVTPAETLSFSLDHLGTPRVITRADRTLAGYHQYLPYGEEWTNGTGVQEGEPKKFTSHERDRDPSGAGTTELDYMHARFYSGRVGRFLSVDPVLDTKQAMINPQDWNRYAYVLNNPINHTDPTGKVVEIDAASNIARLKAYLTETMRRPTGRADVMAVINDPNHTLRMKSGTLNSPAQVQMSMSTHGSATMTFGRTAPAGNVQLQPNGSGQFVVTGSTMTIDTNAISQHHPDNSGVTTTAHEFQHVNDLRSGGVTQMLSGDAPTSATGPAERHGQTVAAENPDLTRAQARELVDQLILVRP